MIATTATIISRKSLTHDTIEFVLRPTEPMPFKPGQFFMIKCVKPSGQVQYRSYSVANHLSDDASIIRFVIKLLPDGLASELLRNKKVGDSIEIRGAGGLFTYKSAEAQKVVMVCTGTGIIPVLSIAEFELQKNATQPIHLLFGTRYKVDIFWEDYLKELAQKHPNFSYDIILSKPVGYWEGKKGYVTQELKHFTDSRYHYYICGLPQMIEDAKQHLISVGITPNQIFEEKYISVGLSQEK